MKKWLAPAALLFAAPWFAGALWFAAAQHPKESHPDNFAYPRRFQVPKQYGRFVAVYADQLLFEDVEGTIRSVYPNGGKVIFEVRRR